MIGKRSIYVHAGLVVTGAALALSVWTRDKQPKALVQSDITIWQGKPRDVESISFESKKKRVSLTAKKDDIGRYFTGTVTKDRTPLPPPGDAGAPEPAAESTVVTGVLSITPVEKLVDLLAPLKAVRTVGQVAADREAEFGLDDPEGTLTVKIGDAEKKLLIGGPTPGGGDRYARDPGTREVYVVKGDVFTKVDAADTALMERDLHEWKDAEVAGAKILAAGKERAVVRAGDGAKRFWADASSKDTPDETIANWMTKLERLRPTDFPETAPDPRETIVRVEYTGASGSLGYIELFRGPTGDNGKPQYFVQTERTRMLGKVVGRGAEEVEQDVAALVP